MVHRSALAVIAALVLAACGQSAEAPRAPDAPRTPQVTWEAQTSDSGSTLVLRQATGLVVLSVACLREPARMRVTAPSFSEVGSEERLSFGADNEPFVFVAQLADAEPGVAAERDVALDLVDRLLAAETVAVNYGAQNAGPFPAPPREAARSFANVCREIVG